MGSRAKACSGEYDCEGRGGNIGICRLCSKKRKGSRWEEHTRRRRKQSRILIINTKTNSQDGQNVEYNDPEKSGFDRSWDALVGLSGFSSCNGNELDTSIGEKSKRESLCKGRKATYECLGVLEIG